MVRESEIGGRNASREMNEEVTTIIQRKEGSGFEQRRGEQRQ